ncbi:hypothetical protein [Paraferrimonas sedimenticola]|uniref:Uncharacterized protein n=1 Tax=Paraferrimonas sedimenticola TaxID=375674 RepID=A0AA37S0C4_9GAMM|nr:hypothetical protein [Paraferrimonas sedimenticola]GLP98058.1 hypothetical protein GCM10007895_33650 [Paraferrimonas sedimenticola]
MAQTLEQSLTLPYQVLAEFPLPGSRYRLKGSGLLFNQWMRDAQQSGRLWLIMADVDECAAPKEGEVVSLAEVVEVDWLSGSDVTVTLDVTQWGLLSGLDANKRRCSAEAKSCWQDQAEAITPEEPLLRELIHWRRAYALQYPFETIDTTATLTSLDLCLRWLEILPLAKTTKQNLLKSEDLGLIFRYLNQFLAKADLNSKQVRNRV